MEIIHVGGTHETINTNDHNDQLDLLLAQIKNLLSEPITDTSCEQTIQLMIQLSKLIDGNATNGYGFESNGKGTDTTNTTGESTIITGNQMKELFAQIIDLINPPIITSAREQIHELIRQLICLMTEGNGKTITSGGEVTGGDRTTTVENMNSAGGETIGTGGDHTEIRSDVSTSAQPIVGELPIGDSNTATTSNAGEN